MRDRRHGLTVLGFMVLFPTVLIAAEWKKLGPGGGSMGSAIVYSPTRKQVLGFGGHKSKNEVRAFDAPTGKWVNDYNPTKGGVGGNFYGGQTHASWDKKNNHPGPFFLFRTACWDSKRKRMVIQALNLTAAYDPASKTWTDLKGRVEGPDGKPIPGKAQTRHRGPWFMTVAGQWGSMCYDPHNDEILLFPLWACRGTRQTPKTGKSSRTANSLPDDAGISAGHYGTQIFDCKTSVWKHPELGGTKMLAFRTELAGIINDQRDVTRESWKALILTRSDKNAEVAKLMKTTSGIQRKALASLSALQKKLTASNLKGYEAGQIKDALSDLASPQKRLENAAAELAAGKTDALPAICSQQRAAYRELRMIRKHDLYVQPTPRTSTSVVYDSKNKCIVMAGGNTLQGYPNDTWVYDCATRRWQRKAPVPEAANWPGMCFDSKRGLVIYAAAKGAYTYDAAKDSWAKIGPALPKSAYCDLAYDEAADLYVLISLKGKYSKMETYTLTPEANGTPATGKPLEREKVDDAPFPPAADPAAITALKNLKPNVWTAAKPNFEPTHRSWSTMSWDPAMRCVIYEGGGHAGTMDNPVSAYFPEANRWVNSFKTQKTPPLFGSWSCAGGMRAMERGMGLSMHCRWYGSYAGRMVFGGATGFDWATREKHSYGHLQRSPFRYSRGQVVHPLRPEIITLNKPAYYGTQTGQQLYVFNLETGQGKVHKLTGPTPVINAEWSGLTVHPDRDWLVLHGSGDRKKKTDVDTWVLDLKKMDAWRKLELKKTTGSVGMSKLNAIPGTDYVVCTMPHSNDLWVLSLDRQEWQPLGTDEGRKFQHKKRLFDIYGQCVYDPHHEVFIAMQKGRGSKTTTMLLKPNFSDIKWGTK